MKRGWAEYPRQALVVPIIAGTGGVEVGYGLGTCKAVLVLGVNSRRPYDSEYEGWIGEFSVSGVGVVVRAECCRCGRVGVVVVEE